MSKPTAALAALNEAATQIYNIEGDQWQEAYETIEAVINKLAPNPAVTFHDDFQALRKKYPMVYLEAWTPDDFVFDPDKDDDDDDTTPAPVDWNHPFHEITADNLHRHFDAEIGTNWDRIREESVSIK